MWHYYFLDNGGKEMRLSDGRIWRRTIRMMHYCDNIHDAVAKAKELTFGECIEIHHRYGNLLTPAAIVEPDGSIYGSGGTPLVLYDTKGNRL